MSQNLSIPTPQKPYVWASGWFDFVCGTLRLAKQAQKELARQLRPLDLSETQFLVLWRIASSVDPRVPQTELVESLGLSKAQISLHLEKLRDAGWILGVRMSGDRRCQNWCATPAGEKLVQEVVGRIEHNPVALKSLDQTFSDLSDLQRQLPTPPPLKIADAEEQP